MTFATASQTGAERKAETNDPIATAKGMIAAFGAGDLDALIATDHPAGRQTGHRDGVDVIVRRPP